MRAFIVTAVLVTSSLFTCAFAQSPATTAPAASAKYSTEATDIGTLLDDPAARAIVDKYIPGFSSGENVDMARSMTLAGIKQFAPDKVTDEALAAIDADLAKLPAK